MVDKREIIWINNGENFEIIPATLHHADADDTVPDDLMARIQQLAGAEGISTDQLKVRVLNDAVAHVKAANAELDAAAEGLKRILGIGEG